MKSQGIQCICLVKESVLSFQREEPWGLGCIYSLYIYIYIWTVMSHCLNGHETIGTSLLPKWRPYWKRRSLSGTMTKKCVQPSYYISSKDGIYRLGKSKSLIGVFTLIRSRLPSHPHPPPPALMRRLCPLFLMFL